MTSKETKKYSPRNYTKLEPANIPPKGKQLVGDGNRVYMATHRETGVPQMFLDKETPIEPEDTAALTTNRDKAPKIGYFSGVDFDADGKIKKE